MMTRFVRSTSLNIFISDITNSLSPTPSEVQPRREELKAKNLDCVTNRHGSFLEVKQSTGKKPLKNSAVNFLGWVGILENADFQLVGDSSCQLLINHKIN